MITQDNTPYKHLVSLYWKATYAIDEEMRQRRPSPAVLEAAGVLKRVLDRECEARGFNQPKEK